MESATACRSDGPGAGIADPARRDPGWFPRRIVRVRFRDRYRCLSRFAPPPALPEVSTGVFREAGLRYSPTGARLRGCRGLRFSHARGVWDDAQSAFAGRALSAAIWGALAIPVQNGFRG